MNLNSETKPATLMGQEMKSQILKNAVTLFAQKSYHGTSMTSIAKTCGITKASLYHYFRTKTDLLDYIYETVNLSLSEALKNSSDKTLSTEQRLAKIVYAQVEHQIEFHPFLAVFWRERFQLDDAARKRVRAREKIFEKTLENLILEGQQSGIFRKFDLEIALPAIFGALNTVYRWAPRRNTKIDVVAKEILDFILNGISN